jgi:hypothetical protein
MLKTKILTLALFATVLFSSTTAADTAGASLSIVSSPQSSSENFAINIYENSPTSSVNVVSVDLNYDSTQLEFLNVDNSSSSFGGALKSKGGNGTINLIRYVNPPGNTLTGNALISTVVFKTLPGATKGAIGINSSSLILSSGKNIWDGNNNSLTYDFSPTQTPPPAAEPVESSPIAPIPATPATSYSAPPDASTKTDVLKENISPPLALVSNRPQALPATDPISDFIASVVLSLAALVAIYFNAHTYIGNKVGKFSRTSVYLKMFN